MDIVRTTLLGVAGLALGVWISAPVTAGAQAMTGKSAMNMTRDQKIADAMSAAPASISAKATILDWPAKDGDKPVVLRAGSNGWNCLPDMPATEGSDPMCLDQMWMRWVEAYMAKKAPRITSLGIGYMIAPGGSRGSNSDPYAAAATPDNHWGHHPPHMMIVVPDLKSLEGMSTDPHNGGPYVMYKGTPYAHIMAPVTPPMMGAQSMK
jgi:hypothetical protein